MVQNDLMTIKEKIRQLELGSGSGSTVGSDASTAVGKGPSGTFARPPPGIGIRLNDLFIQRKIDFKGWVTQTTNNAVTNGSQTNTKRMLVANQARAKNLANKAYCQYVVQEKDQFTNDGRDAGHHQKRNSRRSPSSCVDEKSLRDWR